MNTELLLKVKTAILADPEKFDMESFYDVNADTACGTTACICGHAIFEAGRIDSLEAGYGREGYSDEDEGGELLGLTNPTARRLFYCKRWPDYFYDRYVNARFDEDRSEMAKVAAERIDHFIATEGNE